MRVHLAGICSPKKLDWYLKEKLAPKFMLESFFYLEDWLFQMPSFDVNNFLLDSGAFTFISQKTRTKTNWDDYVERYAEIINRRGIRYFFELDIDALVGLAEVERLREKLERLTGRKSIPVWHKSRGKQYWLDLIETYDYVAIGGIALGTIKKNEHKFFSWFLRTARERKAKVHGLGFTNLEGLTKYPFYSVDSTSWIGSRYGKMFVFNGATLKAVNKPANSRMTDYRRCDKQSLAAWIKFQHYAETNL